MFTLDGNKLHEVFKSEDGLTVRVKASLMTATISGNSFTPQITSGSTTSAPSAPSLFTPSWSQNQLPSISNVVAEMLRVSGPNDSKCVSTTGTNATYGPFHDLDALKKFLDETKNFEMVKKGKFTIEFKQFGIKLENLEALSAFEEELNKIDPASKFKSKAS